MPQLETSPADTLFCGPLTPNAENLCMVLPNHPAEVGKYELTVGKMVEVQLPSLVVELIPAAGGSIPVPLTTVNAGFVAEYTTTAPGEIEAVKVTFGPVAAGDYHLYLHCRRELPS